MNETFQCGDHEALVTYLYEEGEPGGREAIAAHVARCAACADEIASLQATRTLLASWTPPSASLGLQVTRAEERPQPVVLRPAAWWRQPLPAWAQVAAATLIFGAGLAVGAGSRPAGETMATASPAAAPIATRTADAAAVPVVSRGDLATLDERLRLIEAAQARNASARPVTASTDEAILRRVDARLDERLAESEELRESIRLIADMADGLAAQQRDLEQRVAGIAAASKFQTITVQELKEKQDTLNSMLPRASFRPVSAATRR